MHTYVACMHTCIHAYIHPYIHTFLTYMHAYIHIYIHTHICTLYGNVCNSTMQNSLQASRSLYVGHVAAFCKAKPTKKTHSLKETKHPCRKCIFSWVVCYSMSRHNVKIIEENTFLTIGMHYVLNCFVWNAAWPSHNHTHSCMIGAKPCNIRPFATPPHMRYPLSRKKQA